MIFIPAGNKWRGATPRRAKPENKGWSTATARRNGGIGSCRWDRGLDWKPRATVSGSWSCCSDWDTKVWIGDAAQIRASYVRKQKNDKRDAAHILRLLLENRFPRLWTPSAEQRDIRQMLIHRHKLVEMRTRVKNGLQHLAMNRGMQKKRQLWSAEGQHAFGELAMPGWAGCRRQDLLEMLGYLDKKIMPLDRAAEELSRRDKMAQLLRTQPGVGPITSLAFAVTIGDAARFQRGKQVASYVGLIARERSSGGKQRLGKISKQGNRFLRQLLVEAAQSAVRRDESLRRPYWQRCHRKAKGVAKVAAARKLAVRLYWMLRTNTGYPEIVRIESSPRVPRVVRHGG